MIQDEGTLRANVHLPRILLLTSYTGPLELTRRQKVLVWDDEISLTDDNMPAILQGPGISRMPPRSPRTPLSAVGPGPISTPPATSSARRRHSVTSDFPPPMRRVSSEHARPVSFSAKFSRVHPATTGVTVLEHMERLDAVEAGLKRLGVEEDADDADEEVDVGTLRPKAKRRQGPPPEHGAAEAEADTAPLLSPAAQSERLPAVQEVDSGAVTDDAASVAEEDLVAMSKSMPHLETTPTTSRWTSPTQMPNLDWMDINGAQSPKGRVVIAEVSTASLCV